MSTRTPYVAGNWKMNLDRRGAVDLAAAVREHVGGRADVEVALFPPAVYLSDVAATVDGSPVRAGSQDCCDRASGAFTGEVSAAMVRDVGGATTLVGHSERRHVYGETDALVNAKVHMALAEGLAVVVCVGETLEERQAGRTEDVCRRQLAAALEGLGEADFGRLTVAYEPVWAIGTGHTATPDQAQAVHAYLRGLLGGLAQETAAERVRILYGGSVKPDNAREILAMPDVDGALVGGASLRTDTFLPIVDGGSPS